MSLSPSVKRLLDILTLAAVMLLLAGCSVLTDNAKPEAPVITTTANMPTATTCVSKSLGLAPAYPDSDAELRASAGSPERFLQLVLAGRDKRIARLDELEPVIEGCRK